MKLLYSWCFFKSIKPQWVNRQCLFWFFIHNFFHHFTCSCCQCNTVSFVSGCYIISRYFIHCRHDWQMVLRKWSESSIRTYNIHIMQFWQKADSSTRSRSNYANIDRTNIAAALTTTGNEKVLTFCWFEHKGYTMFGRTFICKSFVPKLIHQIAKYHPLTHHNLLLSGSDKVMS